MKKILITGATGLVGSHLLHHLIDTDKYKISILTRNKEKAKKELQLPIEIFEWDLTKGTIDSKALEGQDIIIHLAGENVASRWNSQTKDKIISSRLISSSLLISEIKKFKTQNKIKLISASAIGIYGDRSSEELTEESSQASTFLASVCSKWEKSILNHHIEGLKSYCLRIGIVLSTDGGALKKMLPAFKLNLAGPLGSGQQFMSWIHIDDLISQIQFLVDNDPEQQVFNAVSPEPVTNSIFTKTLAEELGCLSLFRVPQFLIKLIAGEMSTILLSSQKVIPKNFIRLGYQFKFPKISSALSNILRYEKKDEVIFIENQWLNKSPEDIFDFFSEVKNLEKITPSHLSFKVLNMSTPQIQEGSIIDYRLKLHGIPFNWKTLITSFNKNDSFIDQQEKGPYKKWLHTHTFKKSAGGTLIRDHVVYKIPLGTVGRFITGTYIKKDLSKIFNYRKEIIKQEFK